MGRIQHPLHAARLLDVRVLQQTDNSCSLACMTMLVNAARAVGVPKSAGKPLSQLDLLNRVGCGRWNSAVAPGGDGVTLDELEGLARKSLATCGISNFELDVVHVDQVTPAVRTRVRRALGEIGRCASRFLVANFLQSAYTGAEHDTVGHFALVAGYDRDLASVLVLDPDLRDYHPYWVTEETFLDGMATHDESAGRSRGYLSVRVEPARG